VVAVDLIKGDYKVSELRRRHVTLDCKGPFQDQNEVVVVDWM